MLFIGILVYISIYLSIYQYFIYLSIYLSIYLFIYLFIYLLFLSVSKTSCVRVCVCVCVCVCACVCVFVFIYFHRKGFSWLNKTINVMSEVQVRDGMLRKYFCVKNLCHHVIDNHSRDLQTSNCAKKCQINQVEPREVKDNS